jgi:hypothetical protein
VNLRSALSPADKTRHSVDLVLGKQAGSLAAYNDVDDERVVQLVHPALSRPQGWKVRRNCPNTLGWGFSAIRKRQLGLCRLNHDGPSPDLVIPSIRSDSDGGVEEPAVAGAPPLPA